ncbi:hypothetical protein FRB99_000138 [Tulasnella sp. 403]|nr:hypothetical protein FRB99_000138 [Tulasnella sp. 403]
MSSVSSISVFFLGATGYIGGSVLVGLQRQHPNFSYTAIVRKEKDIAPVEALGVKVIQANYQQLEVMEQLAASHDVVVNCADSDDVPLINAIIRGQERRRESNPGGQKPILIQTSGTGLVTDTPDGSFHPGVSDKVYDDNLVEDIKSIGSEQPHRDVDLLVFAAGNRGLIDTYIIAPSTIYGKGTGPVHITSIQVNEMIRFGLERKEVIYVGPGTNIWGCVHIDDLVDLYNLVFDRALSGNTAKSAYENFFWGTAGEYVWHDLVTALAKVMHERGLVNTPVPKSLPFEGSGILEASACNSRTVANRSLSIGWRIGTRKSIFDTLPEEIDITLVEQ